MPDNNELSPSEMFLKYDYPETKDMCKQFLTLITTVLVISLTFSDKIVGFSNASTASKGLVISSWTSFLLAIIFCGLGLVFVTMAAGGFFILGVLLLISTAIVATYNNTVDKDISLPLTLVKMPGVPEEVHLKVGKAFLG